MNKKKQRKAKHEIGTRNEMGNCVPGFYRVFTGFFTGLCWVLLDLYLYWV